MSFDLPTNEPCHIVNQTLWGTFSDCHKDLNGFRPRGTWTEAEVVQWLDWYDSPEGQAILQAEIKAMDERIAQYEAELATEQARLEEAASEAEYYAQFGWLEEKFDRAA